MSNILIFSEKSDLLCEMLSKACQLADDNQSIVAVGWGDSGEYANYGADRVFILEELSENDPIEMVTPVLNTLVDETESALILIGGTKRGKEIAARLGSLQDALCITDCKNISVDGSGSIITSRMVFGGIAVQTETINQFPLIMTVPARTFVKEPYPKNASVDKITIPVSGQVRVLERRARASGNVQVEEADIVVCVGRGFENQDDLSLAQQLAAAIGGVVACTRPIAEDFHWMSEETYIGLTGKTVQAKLHITIGTSGQIQYVTGIRDAGVIVAIDMDEKASIWEASDYGIVGNLYDIVPALTSEFKKAIG